MDREFREQVLELSLAADDMHGLPTLERWIQQPMSNEFGQHLNQANSQRRRPATGPTMHRLLQFAAHRKNLVCIPKHCVAEFGQHEIATETLESLSSKNDSS